MTDRVYTNLTITSGSLITKNVQISNGLTCSNINASNVTIGNLIVTGSTITVNVTEQNVVDTNITTGSLNATGITAGNINFTGSLTQNGAVFGASTTGSGNVCSFRVTGSTAGTTYFKFMNAGYVSSDKLNWVYTGPPAAMPITYGGGLWAGAGNSSLSCYSVNGFNWTTVSNLVVTTPTDIVYNSYVSRFVAVGGGSSDSYTTAYSNTSGTSWTSNGNIGGKKCIATATNATSGVLFVAGGLNRAYGGQNYPFHYSNDGISWNPVNSVFTYSSGVEVTGIAYSPTLKRWVAVGSGDNANSIGYSNDGSSWTGLGLVSASSNQNSYYCVIWGGSLFVAGKNSYTNTYYPVVYSSDGITWSGSSSIDVDGSLIKGFNRITWDGTYYTAYDQSTGYVYQSTNASTWTNISKSAGSNMSYISTYPVVWTGISGTSANSLISNQQIVYNIGNNYNNSTGTFTAPVTGLYNVSYRSLNHRYAYITSGSSVLSSTNFFTVGNISTDLVYMSSGNTLNMYIQAGTWDNTSFWGAALL